MVEIKKLTKANLREAVRLVCSAFPPEGELESADMELPASLNPVGYKDYLDKTQMTDLKYWVAISSARLVGVVGIYSYQYEKTNTAWLGWFVVDPGVRNGGIGKDLLHFAIEQARAIGKKSLKVYVVPDEDGDFRSFYEKKGFKFVGSEPWEGPDEGLTKYYYELDLKGGF